MLKLESTAKTIPTLTKKIEQYKNQAVELERQNFEAKSAVAVKDSEVVRLREDLEAASQVIQAPPPPTSLCLRVCLFLSLSLSRGKT